MSAILVVSIGIRMAAFILSLLLLRRLKDWRIGFLSGMILLMALRQILTLAKKPIDLPISVLDHQLDENGFVEARCVFDAEDGDVVSG